MALVSFRGVSKAFGGTVVLDHASLEIPRSGKIGLVGENGSGKSTILRLIGGALQPDAGEVSVARSLRLWHVPQIPDLRAHRTAFEEILASRPVLAEMRTRILSLESQLHKAALSGEGAATAYAEALAEFAQVGGSSFEREAQEVARAFGLTQAHMSLPVERLSGGERARVALAQAILADASLLLLDEPDSHLDVEGIEQLEGLLQRYRGAFVLVTHDRELLDRVVDQIVEIEEGKLTQQRGTFSDFLVRKRERIELQKRLYLEQERRLRRLHDSIHRIETRARGIENRTIHFHYRKQAAKIARRAVMMKRRLERELEGETHVEKPRGERERIRLSLAPGRWHAGSVLCLEGITKAFGDRVLFSGVSLEVCRGRRIAIVGPNGSGKTTLMEIALGLEPADEGDVWLSRAASPFYCDQKQAGLDPRLSVVETMVQNTDLSYGEVRYLLAQLVFRAASVHGPVSNLSGGERTRLVLAVLMNARADLLMLDEPTNHLDWSSIEVLQEALARFEGAVLLISHDRRLIDAVATDVFELRNGVFARRGWSAK